MVDRVSGRVFIVPRAKERRWELWVENTGQVQVGVTQNILPAHRPDYARHDDLAFGHGLLTDPGCVSYQEFPEGARYRHISREEPLEHEIAEGCFLRLGLRGCASRTVPLPKLDGKPVEIDFGDFQWYRGSPATATPTTDKMAEFARTRARHPIHTNVRDGKNLLARIQELMNDRDKVACEGFVEIRPVQAIDGEISHWELRFENSGRQAWIGTAVFEGAEKNDGIGLESMPVPGAGTAAMQRLENMGNYGVTAKPGSRLRLGVRGYGHAHVELPSRLPVRVSISDFTRGTSQYCDDFFDGEKVKAKRAEKFERVQFFEGGRAINEEILPIVYRGSDAVARASFQPPQVIVRAIDDPARGRGWTIDVTSTLPNEDERGELGMMVSLRLGEDSSGADVRVLPSRALAFEGATACWFLKEGTRVGTRNAAPGVAFVVAAGGTGWSAEIPLPSRGGTIDTAESFDLWGFREDRASRRALERRSLAC